MLIKRIINEGDIIIINIYIKCQDFQFNKVSINRYFILIILSGFSIQLFLDRLFKLKINKEILELNYIIEYMDLIDIYGIEIEYIFILMVYGIIFKVYYILG